jgi:hypothetical protein
MLLKYVAGQLLCQSVAGLTKGFRTKAFPVSGRPDKARGTVEKLKHGGRSRVAGKAEHRVSGVRL